MKINLVKGKNPAWEALEHHRKLMYDVRLKDLFADDPNRFKKFSLQVGDLLFDFSKQRIIAETLEKLCALAKERNIEQEIESLFLGRPINTSENRAVLHTALRDLTEPPLLVNGQNIKADIKAVLKKIEVFSEKLRRGEYRGVTGQTITDVLALGIGGSDLGPQLVTHALKHFQDSKVRVHFISNVDAETLQDTLKLQNPHNTLCLINSKSFTTPETLMNAKSIKKWYQEAFQGEVNVNEHLFAVTAKPEKALSLGILKENIFEFWDWVGGRFSIWSSVGLPIAILLGMEHFKAFLKGAYLMDQHFKEAPISQNMPMIMALLGIWNINFWNYFTLAIIPYGDGLSLFPAYLQQLEMESNGKRVNKQGEPLTYATAPTIWGGVGCNGQHAYMQWLHQGSLIAPVDFLVAAKSSTTSEVFQEQQKFLVASCFSQSKALMEGTLLKEGEKGDQALLCPGNRPSSTLLYPQLTPEILGSLIALYEHKVFVQGVIWNINSFDQWGVELGKTLVKTLLPELDNQPILSQNDNSTEGLISFYQSHN